MEEDYGEDGTDEMKHSDHPGDPGDTLMIDAFAFTRSHTSSHTHSSVYIYCGSLTHSFKPTLIYSFIHIY